MHSRKLTHTLFAPIVLFLFSACSSVAPEPISNTPALQSKNLTAPPTQTVLPGRSELTCIDEEFLCVGLVTAVGAIDDKSFNQAAWEGVVRSQVDLLAEIDYIETGKFSDIVSNIKFFGDQHYDIIVTVGSKMNAATIAMVDKYPHTHFIGIGDPLSPIISF